MDDLVLLGGVFTWNSAKVLVVSSPPNTDV
jgi:hypothetical protein